VFLEAEDGIRDLNVTGVQTCALPIFLIAPDGKLQLMNQAMCEQLGLTESKLNADFTQTITDPKLIQMIYQVQSNHQLLHEELTKIGRASCRERMKKSKSYWLFQQAKK